MEPSETPYTGRHSPDLARTLQGALPCARCRYQLRGLSIRGTCPECGLPVRATVLAAVDPAADELKPLRRPRLLVAGLVAWSVGALIAGLGVLSMRVTDLLLSNVDHDAITWRLSELALAGVIVSWVSSLVLIRPHPGTPRANTVRAIVGVAAYSFIVAGMAYLHFRHDPGLADSPYTRPDVVVPLRSAIRLATGMAILVAIIFLRPNARLLATRSLVLRTGRVDRQPMYALAAAVVVAMLGDVAHLATLAQSGTPRDILWWIGSMLIAVGSMLFLIGLVGIVIDCLRVSRVLLEPSPSMRDVFGRTDQDGTPP